MINLFTLSIFISLAVSGDLVALAATTGILLVLIIADFAALALVFLTSSIFAAISVFSNACSPDIAVPNFFKNSANVTSLCILVVNVAMALVTTSFKFEFEVLEVAGATEGGIGETIDEYIGF
jgi:hypothetical protein